MKIVIAGSRDITSQDLIDRYADILDDKYDITHVISGRAKGVDTCGETWANKHNKDIIYFPADWDKHGKKAGILRNLEMLKQADIILVIMHNDSRGSTHMASIAQTSGKPTYVYNTDTKEGKKFNIS